VPASAVPLCAASLSVELTSGSLNSLTPQEISSLIRALFEESAHRARFLQLLSAATGSGAGIVDAPSRLRHLADASTHRALSLASSALSAGSRIKQALHDTKHRLQH